MKKGLKLKLLSIFGFLLFIIALNSIWAIINFQRLNNSIDNIMKQNYDSIVYAQDMIYALDNQNNLIVDYLYVEGTDIDTNLVTNETNFLSLLVLAEKNITEDGEREILDSIRTNYTDYIVKYNQLLASNQLTSEEKKVIYRSLNELYHRISSKCKDLLNLNQQGMSSRKNQSYAIAQNATYSMITISIISISSGIIISLILTEKITNPLRVLIEKIKNIAQGDYEQELEVTGSDEIAKLGSEFNVMSKKLLQYKNLNIKKVMAEKQKAEAIVQSINDGIIVTNEDHKILLVNHAAEKALNVRENDVINLHFLEAIKNEKIFKIIKEVGTKSRKKIPSKSFEDVTINNEDGQQDHYRIYVKSIKTKQEESIGVVTLLQNITKLKEVDQIKSEFISTVSHEFRTPLTSISMAVGLLLNEESKELNSDQHELLDVINEDSKRLNNLVTDLLDFSKIESGKVQMDLINCDINKIIEHAVKPFEMQTKEKNVQLIVHKNNQLSKVKADYNKIIWIITNLIGNALRYVEKDIGIIEVNAKQVATKMLVSVKDNGKGIPEEYQDKIFEKFIQINNYSNKGSAGLGLTICKEIIKAHGGDIWVESKLNEGSTFYFSLNLSM